MADPLALELEAIRRGISKADLMQQQAMAPRQIISPTQGLAQLAQAFVAGRAQKQAQERLSEYQKQAGERSDELARLLSEGDVKGAIAASGDTALQLQYALSERKADLDRQTELAKRKLTIEDKAAEKAARAEEKRQEVIAKGQARIDALNRMGKKSEGLDPESVGRLSDSLFAKEHGLGRSQISEITDLVKTLTPSHQSKATIDLLEQGKGVKKAVKSFDELIDEIDRNPSVVTVGGTVSEVASAIAENLKGLGEVLGFEPESIDVGINASGNMAAQSASARAKIKKVVRDYARSLGESGKSLSDKDLVDFTQQVAARWGNPEAIKRVLTERRNDLVTGFQSDVQIHRDAGMAVPESAFLKFDLRKVPKPTAEQPTAQATTSGWRIIE